MSHVYYRGYVKTDKEAKGPFTEAKDDFADVFTLLTKNSQTKVAGDKAFIRLGSVVLSFSREGDIEVFEGAA